MPVWCGGMLEAGVGRAHNIALSTLPNFVLPGAVAEAGLYAPEYQILDNAGHADGKKPETSAASTYALYAPVRDVTRPPGEWRSDQGCIVSTKGTGPSGRCFPPSRPATIS